MKKVGILTFHYADNYGAVLQAYALRKKINSFDGYEAGLINYVPRGFAYPLPINSEEIYKKMIEKRKLFERFLVERCGIDKPMIHKITGNEYDYYCVGSDQVWNLQSGIVNEDFFLANLDDNACKFAYATSITMNVKVAEGYADVFAKYVSGFKAVSLREEEHVEFIEKTCKLPCRTVADPSLLLTAEDYEEVMCQEVLRAEPFIFFFWLQHDHELLKGVEFANMLSRKYGLPVVHSISDAAPCMFAKDGGCMMYEGIEHFLWYIKHARVVVTNSYHATLFSMQFQTKFYVFPIEYMRSRIDMLSTKYDIGERLIERYVDCDKINPEMDFEYIQKTIQKERSDAILYLKDALDMKEE